MIRSSLQTGEGPHRPCNPKGSPLGLHSFFGSSRVRESSPRRGSRRHGRPSLVRPCEPTRSLSPTPEHARSWRRNNRPARARPRSPCRRRLAHSLHSRSASPAPQSEFSRITSDHSQRPSDDCVRFRLRNPRRNPHGARRRRRPVQPIPDLATLPRLDRDRSRDRVTCPKTDRSTAIRGTRSRNDDPGDR
jgi:hypothetical protein